MTADTVTLACPVCRQPGYEDPHEPTETARPRSKALTCDGCGEALRKPAKLCGFCLAEQRVHENAP